MDYGCGTLGDTGVHILDTLLYNALQLDSTKTITNKCREPNGFGFQTYKNGNKYFGEHKNGFPNGQGRSIYPDGSMYLGEYKNGKFHGQGTFIWNDGYYHEGEFMDGTPNGQGTQTLPNGQLVGEYKDGKPWNVKGYDKEGDITGKWVNGKMIKQ
mgnify:CR=1 FL=1